MQKNFFLPGVPRRSDGVLYCNIQMPLTSYRKKSSANSNQPTHIVPPPKQRWCLQRRILLADVAAVTSHFTLLPLGQHDVNRNKRKVRQTYASFKGLNFILYPQLTDSFFRSNVESPLSQK